MSLFLKTIWSDITLVFVLSYRTLEKLLDTGEYKKLLFLLVGLIIAWHVYTPIHELLHVAGCLMTGGTVEELALKPQYGGTILQEFFPFIVPDSDYAGQLTGFTTPNKWAYAVVDFTPFVLSLFGGLTMAVCYEKRWTWLFGVATILSFVPIVSLPGDFFEAASLATSEWLGMISENAGYRLLISDDVFKLIPTLIENQQMNITVSFFILVTVLLAILFILVLFALQGRIVNWVYGSDFCKQIMKKTSSS